MTPPTASSPAVGAVRTLRPVAPARRSPALAWVDVAVLGTLVLLALAPFAPVFGSGRALVATVGGVVLAAAVGVAGAWRHWSGLTVSAVGVVVLAAGSALVAPDTAVGGVLPTASTLAGVAQGVLTAWGDVLALTPPVGIRGGVLAVPYLLAFVTTLVAVTVALRTARSVPALIAPAFALVAAVLLATSETGSAAVTGVVAALTAVVWGSWRTGHARPDRWVPLGAMMLVGVLLGTGAGLASGASGTLTGGARLVLRDHLTPPADVHRYPSPLAGYRSFVKDHGDDALLTVEGLPAGAPVRLAVLDTYDGTVWAVSDGAATGSGEFRRVGERIEPDPVGGVREIDVAVGDYADVWVPMVGRPFDLDFTGGAERLNGRLFVNRETGTGVVPAGLSTGDTYRLRVALAATPSTSALTGAPIARVELPPAGYPDSAATAAGRLTSGATTPLARIQALEAGLQQGYFSHGLEGDTPSLAGHGAARIDALLTGEAMVGDAEQYAAAMALMLRTMDIPSRVVLGFEAPQAGESVTLTGADLTAWVEVPFVGHGWVPFHPTPDADRIWQSETTEPQDQAQPQVLQPPPPVPDPPDAPRTARERGTPEADEPDPQTGWGPGAVAAVAGGGVLLLLLSPLLGVLALKGRRRARRRTRGGPADQIAGGWDELVDAVTDLGVPPSPTATRRQAAGQMAATLGDPGRPASGALVLAERVDAGTFGPDEPDEATIGDFWAEVGAALGGLRRRVGRRRWWRSRLSVRSLRRR
ncbi:MAG: transglutaminase family protein [Georgenia sp.]